MTRVELQKLCCEIPIGKHLPGACYFASVTLVNTGVGVSVWILVGLLGLPHPLLWGVAAFLLHYIPFVGATRGIVAMTLVSLIHFDSVWYALLPPLAYLFCAMIEGNLATPIFLGRWLTLKSNRHSAEFSALVIPLGCPRDSVGCSHPGDVRNILRSNRAVETVGCVPGETLTGKTGPERWRKQIVAGP